MKKIFSLFVLLMLVSNFIIAQVPKLINYQGVALSNTGLPIANTTITINASIWQVYSSGGGLIYSETRQVTTDDGGLFNFQIGSTGTTYVYGSMEAVAASKYKLSLEIKMDPGGGSNLVSMGYQNLASVPFSFKSIYADTLRLPFVGQDETINSFVINNNYNGSGIAIKGSSFSNNTNAVGIYGVVPLGNTAGSGVRGQAFNTGAIALEGINTAGVAIRGKAAGVNGIAIQAENTNASGKALDVNGNVKIAGGNTNPGAGRVLTSDAAGNATWKDPIKVAFRATGENTTSPSIPAYSSMVVPLQTELFDIGADFNTSSASTDPNTFITPVNGVYHFSAHIKVYITSNVYNISSSEIKLLRNGNVMTYLVGTPAEVNTQSSAVELSIDQTVQLNAGDKIQFAIEQGSLGNLSGKYLNADFSGHLVFAL